MSDVLVRVNGSVMRLPGRTDVKMDSGIDWLENLRVGDLFALEVEVVDLEDGRITVSPCGPAEVDDA
jgi:hypothetical protein